MIAVDLGGQPLAVLLATLGAAGIVVWYAATRLVRYVDAIAARTGIGHAFAGMLLLGGATTLPELATAGTAAASGNPLLTINDLLGSASMNLVLLALGDLLYGRDALTSVAGRPVTLMQGTLGMMLLAGVGVSIALTDVVIPLVGAGVFTVLIAAGCLQALRISRRFERADTWRLAAEVQGEPVTTDELECSHARLAMLSLAAALAIFAGGATLATAGDAIAETTGAGDSIVGFALLGFATSLPEFSTILAALRLGRDQLAIGDVFGAILFNTLILFVGDLFYRDGALLNAAGTFEIAASCLALILIGLFMIGLLERRNRTIGRMGTDSVLVLATYAAGLIALSQI